mmetsp:Transcript_27891/g.56441  ORF Transcript_27891/g.56441 Transcript_27891/m.56441 type:complete len:99 (-) Transcript_27891:124-420(-)
MSAEFNSPGGNVKISGHAIERSSQRSLNLQRTQLEDDAGLVEQSLEHEEGGKVIGEAHKPRDDQIVGPFEDFFRTVGYFRTRAADRCDDDFGDFLHVC